MKVSQARRLKELERENGRLKRAVADLTLDKLILEEAAKGNFWVKSRVVCKSERKLLDASVRLPWRPPSVREA